MKLVLLALTLFGVSVCLSHKIVPRQVTALPSYTKLSDQQIKHLQSKGFGPASGAGFQPTAAYEEDDDDDAVEDSSPASSQVRRPTYAEEIYQNPNAIPVIQQRQQIIRRPVNYNQQYVQQQQIEDIRGGSKLKEEEEEEKEEEPDRLSVLLPQSRFDCNGKNGYYADEDLGCEVFHYCQDNAKHSWICPEGFTFHQVHLICMPPGQDNICAKSSQFHFVNDFLYKPINLEEHQRKPNISLKYSDRYYPENYYSGQYEEESESRPQRKHSVKVNIEQEAAPQPQAPIRRPSPTPFSPTFRPDSSLSQVFRSPEEINIPLQQRRPQFVAQRYLAHDDVQY